MRNAKTKKETEEFPIYLSDFKLEVQEKIKEFLGIKTLEELNLDAFPLFVLPKPEIDLPGKRNR